MRSERERLTGNDEIDLFALFEKMWGQKLLILMMVGLGSCLALAYALMATPIYEARVFVQPPSQNDVAQLNYGRGESSGLNLLSVKDVYDVFLRNLQSESLRQEFFRTVYLPGLPDAKRVGSQSELYGRFQKMLKIGVASKDNPTRFVVEFELPDANKAAEWAIQYVEMAGRRGLGEVIRDVKADATVKAGNLSHEISAARASANKTREDQIVKLNEALRVARSIGLEKPPIISNTLTSEVSAGMGGALIYMRGTKALEAEIDNLRSRTSDDPFVQDLREREGALAFYQSLQIDEGAVRVYSQDGSLDLPDKPVNLNKLFVVALGGVVGGILGFLIAFFRSFRRLMALGAP